MTFGSRLTWARETAGVTQKQLSESSQIGESSISEYENDGRDPSALQLVRIGEVLKRRPEFFFETGEPQREVVLWREKPCSDAAQIEL